MKKLIVGATIPNKIYDEFRGEKLPNPRMNGFPGILTALPEGDNVRYMIDYNDMCELDDNQVEFYMIEICAELFSPSDKFKNWISKINKNKIVIGGAALPVLRDEDIECLNAGKIILGDCDDVMLTIQQPGYKVKGITNYQKLPRYDLLNINEIFKKNDCFVNGFDEYGLATSSGCLCNCNFCYQSIAGNVKHISKPLDYLEKECKSMVSLYGTANKCFLYDANFTMSKTWKEALTILRKNNFSKHYGFFASANTIKPGDAEFMRENDVYCISLGLEDINKNYSKNANITEVCRELYANGIGVNIGYIVNPEDLINPESERITIEKLHSILYDLRPINVFRSFLRIMYGTNLYYEYLKRPDFNMNEYLNVKKTTEFKCVNSIIKDPIRSEQIIQNQIAAVNVYNSSRIYKGVLSRFRDNAYLK